MASANTIARIMFVRIMPAASGLRPIAPSAGPAIRPTPMPGPMAPRPMAMAAASCTKDAGLTERTSSRSAPCDTHLPPDQPDRALLDVPRLTLGRPVGDQMTDDDKTRLPVSHPGRIPPAERDTAVCADVADALVGPLRQRLLCLVPPLLLDLRRVLLLVVLVPVRGRA